jgi:hypothetical protein
MTRLLNTVWLKLALIVSVSECFPHSWTPRQTLQQASRDTSLQLQTNYAFVLLHSAPRFLRQMSSSSSCCVSQPVAIYAISGEAPESVELAAPVPYTIKRLHHVVRAHWPWV